jgi:hypothetical protein
MCHWLSRTCYTPCRSDTALKEFIHSVFCLTTGPKPLPKWFIPIASLVPFPLLNPNWSSPSTFSIFLSILLLSIFADCAMGKRIWLQNYRTRLNFKVTYRYVGPWFNA